MRISCVFLLLVLALARCTEQKKAVTISSANKAPATVVSQPKKEVFNDFTPVSEMLGRNCSPCHNPGGKMYERLPFDNPEIVASHGASIQGRLKSPDDLALIQAWLKAHQ